MKREAEELLNIVKTKTCWSYLNNLKQPRENGMDSGLGPFTLFDKLVCPKAKFIP